MSMLISDRRARREEKAGAIYLPFITCLSRYFFVCCVFLYIQVMTLVKKDAASRLEKGGRGDL